MKKLKTFVPDLILLDIILPRSDGWEVLNRIRANPKIAPVPVVIITNLTDKHSREKGVELGVVNYLIKSDYNLEELVNKIKEILKK